MKIHLINKDTYNRILSIYKDNPVLTLNNNGYEEIMTNTLSDSDKIAIEELSSILEKHIIGFQRFQNFQNIKDIIRIRFQYNYQEDPNQVYFIGVGYLELDELLNGFNPE